MNPNPVPNDSESAIPINPEDNAALQAIEALEAQTVDPNPRPLDLSELTNPKPVIKVAPIVKPRPVAPVISTPQPTIPVVPVRVVPPAPVVAPVAVPVVSVPVIEKPATTQTPAAEMAAELANAPASKPFQFFLHQKASRKQIGIAIAIIIGIIIGVAVYLGFRSLQ